MGGGAGHLLTPAWGDLLRLFEVLTLDLAPPPLTGQLQKLKLCNRSKHPGMGPPHESGLEKDVTSTQDPDPPCPDPDGWPTGPLYTLNTTHVIVFPKQSPVHNWKDTHTHMTEVSTPQSKCRGRVNNKLR